MWDVLLLAGAGNSPGMAGAVWHVLQMSTEQLMLKGAAIGSMEQAASWLQVHMVWREHQVLRLKPPGRLLDEKLCSMRLQTGHCGSSWHLPQASSKQAAWLLLWDGYPVQGSKGHTMKPLLQLTQVGLTL